MAELKNPVDILKLLEKTNCRECGYHTCMAFALAVSRGQASLADCPRLPAETAERYGGEVQPIKNVEEDQRQALEGLKQQVREIDLEAAAKRLGARFARGRLIVKMLGKDVGVDRDGNLYSDIHLHGWVLLPFFLYVLNGKGLPVSGNWITFRELPGAKPREGLFVQRSELPLKKVADSYPDLFEDMIHIFNGKPVTEMYQADISLVLHPLPLVPVLICYWKTEDGMDSDLHVFFDETADANLGVDGLYTLFAGLVTMFEKLAVRHGYMVQSA